MATKPLRLITEINEDVAVLTEDVSGEPQHFIEGIFLQAERKNRNGRLYPLPILQREALRYDREYIKEDRAVGELGHPPTPAMNMDRVSHKILSLEQQGKDFLGRAQILDTPMGRIVKTFIKEHVKFGVSSRGLGSIIEGTDGNRVGDDYVLVTAADVVYDPSAPEAFVRGIMEHKEWVWDNGIVKEHEVAALKTIVEHAPARKQAARMLVEATAFERFLNMIRVRQ